MADISYLKEQAVLAILEDEALVGIMPYFRKYIKVGGQEHSVYSASRHAIEGFTDFFQSFRSNL